LIVVTTVKVHLPSFSKYQQQEKQKKFPQSEVHCHVSLPVSQKFLIGAKLLTEMWFTYYWLLQKLSDVILKTW